MITAEALKPKDSNFSPEKAKAAAEELLAIDSDKIELKIEAVQERKNYKGQEVYSVQYMYETKNGEQGLAANWNLINKQVNSFSTMMRNVIF